MSKILAPNIAISYPTRQSLDPGRVDPSWAPGALGALDFLVLGSHGPSRGLLSRGLVTAESRVSPVSQDASKKLDALYTSINAKVACPTTQSFTRIFKRINPDFGLKDKSSDGFP